MNTIIRRPSDGKLIGYNTDYLGAISAIEDGMRGFCILSSSIEFSSMCKITKFIAYTDIFPRSLTTPYVSVGSNVSLARFTWEWKQSNWFTPSW